MVAEEKLMEMVSAENWCCFLWLAGNYGIVGTRRSMMGNEEICRWFGRKQRRCNVLSIGLFSCSSIILSFGVEIFNGKGFRANKAPNHKPSSPLIYTNSELYTSCDGKYSMHIPFQTNSVT